MSALIRAGKPSTGSGGASLTGKRRAGVASITGKRGSVLAMVETPAAIKTPAVRTTATRVSTLVDLEDTRFLALQVAES